MARLADRDPANVDGRWYVDTRCIDCDVARHHAPELIGTLADGRSVVVRQPSSPDEELAMWRAALACPTRSIGTADRARPPEGVFPFEVTAGVWLCGHNDRRSFGAHAWFANRPGGNLLVDAPHWEATLVSAFRAMGGIGLVLLTHRDDVADAERYAAEFGADVWIHEDDRTAAPFATHLIEGADPYEIAPGVLAFPVPGHTRGSVVYHVDGHLLFTGDSLAWFWRRGDLGAFRDACWYSWDEQRASLDRLARSVHRFDWVLPGHGKWHTAPPAEFRQRLIALVARM
jgi:glyoxylase-like metal-dependent hydrolase (beta-lactamase superfamily II)